MNNRQLVNIIKYSDLREGECVIKLGEELVQLQIQSLLVDKQHHSYTEVTVTGIVNK
jgi:hypothetical protein